MLARDVFVNTLNNKIITSTTFSSHIELPAELMILKSKLVNIQTSKNLFRKTPLNENFLPYFKHRVNIWLVIEINERSLPFLNPNLLLTIILYLPSNNKVTAQIQ